MRVSATASSRRHPERGQALLAAGIFLIAMFALVAIAVEVSRLTDTATEVQVAADAAALAAGVASARGQTEGDAITTGQNTGALNFANGSNVPLADVVIDPGNYDPTRALGDKFRTGDVPHNAFRATVTLTDVRYILATLLNGRTSTGVQKNAVAVPDCPSEGAANFPMTICNSYLSETQPGQQCSDQPRLNQIVPTGGQAACWTSLSLASASSSTLKAVLPEACGGGGGTALSVGDSISLQNGQVNGFLQQVQCCVACADQHKFILPVVDCSYIYGSNPCNGQAAPVLGFATINIANYQDVLLSGGGTNNCRNNGFPNCTSPPDGRIDNVNSPLSGIYVNQTCSADPGGHGGGRCFGVNTVILGQLP